MGDVWELLGHLLDFWAEKLCAVTRTPSPATQPATAESVKARDDAPCPRRLLCGFLVQFLCCTDKNDNLNGMVMVHV